MSPRFNPPPNWPAPPDGWTPPPGWTPSVDWGPLPQGWALWVDEDVALVVSASTTVERPSKVPMFGARSRVKELDAEVLSLRAELAKLQADLHRLGAFELVELEEQRDSLRRETTDSEHAFQAETARREAEQATQRTALDAELAALRSQVVVTQDAEILQEVGIYDYRHPLTDATEYKARLTRVQDQIKAMARKDGGAISATTNWTVNGSAAQGRKMVADFSKLMLRAYNAEADNSSRGLKPYKLDIAMERLEKVAVDHRAARQDDEHPDLAGLPPAAGAGARADRGLPARSWPGRRSRSARRSERLREERKAQQEIEREEERWRRSASTTRTRSTRWGPTATSKAPNAARTARRRRQAIEDVDYRAANIRAGYVYVISNIGAFGERMVKVGMTRRLEPMDRVKELERRLRAVPLRRPRTVLLRRRRRHRSADARSTSRSPRQPRQPPPRVLLRHPRRSPGPALGAGRRAAPVRGAAGGTGVPTEHEPSRSHDVDTGHEPVQPQASAPTRLPRERAAPADASHDGHQLRSC